MLKTVQKLMTALAATGLVLTPVAAHANTRAGDNAGFYTGSQSQPGLGRTAGGERVGGGAGEIIALILAGLWAAGIVVVAADVGDDDDDDDNNQSPGAN